MTWRLPTVTEEPSGQILFQKGFITDGIFNKTSGDMEVNKWFNPDNYSITYQERIPPNYNYLVGAVGPFSVNGYKQGYKWTTDGTNWYDGYIGNEVTDVTTSYGRTNKGMFWSTPETLYIVKENGTPTIVSNVTAFGSSLYIDYVHYENGYLFVINSDSKTVGYSSDGGSTWNQVLLPDPDSSNDFRINGPIRWTGSSWRFSHTVGDGVSTMYGAAWDWDGTTFSNYVESELYTNSLIMCMNNGNYYIFDGGDTVYHGTDGYSYPNSFYITSSFTGPISNGTLFVSSALYLTDLITSLQGPGNILSDPSGSYVSDEIDSQYVYSCANDVNNVGRVLITNENGYTSKADLLYINSDYEVNTLVSSICDNPFGVALI